MTYEEWAATIGRGVTINPQMAFAAGAASRDAEVAELAENLERMLWYFDNYGEKMRHNEFQRFRNGKFNTDASSSAVEFNEVMDGEIESAKAALAKVRKP